MTDIIGKYFLDIPDRRIYQVKRIVDEQICGLMVELGGSGFKKAELVNDDWHFNSHWELIMCDFIEISKKSAITILKRYNAKGFFEEVV